MEYAPIAGIAIVLFVLAEIVKRTVLKNNDDMKAVLPYVCALLGAVAGVVCYVIDPTLIPGADNVLSAVVAGACSGLLATGAHQIYKQFTKLMLIGRSTTKEIEEEVADMTTEEKKEYLTGVATDMITDVLNGVNGVSDEADTGSNNVKDPSTSESSEDSNENTETANEDNSKQDNNQ